jgi:hypothetical protein
MRFLKHQLVYKILYNYTIAPLCHKMPAKDGHEGLGTHSEQSGYMVKIIKNQHVPNSDSTNELPPFDAILYVII